MPIVNHIHSAERARIPTVRVRGGSTVFDIDALDEALAFAQANPHPKGDYDGMIRRLESASLPEDCIEAGNAFRWWAEANDLTVADGAN